jgi:hypothetical protein
VGVRVHPTWGLTFIALEEHPESRFRGQRSATHVYCTKIENEMAIMTKETAN